jgi:hypothetical protein
METEKLVSSKRSQDRMPDHKGDKEKRTGKNEYQ